MPNINNIKKYKNIFMIGIGGVSMSGIAAILNNWGFNITGSDLVESDSTNALKKLGIKVTIGHDLDSIKNSDIVVYSAAINNEYPEMLEATKYNIPTIERADFLGEITRCYLDTICISGTHGKTTTTSMVSLCFIEGLLDPSIQVGAYLKQIDGNYRVGNSDHFIIEACEYVESFLKFTPKTEVILNIDNDHLDYFKTFENIKKAFIKYVKLLPEDGNLIINVDDKSCIELKNYTRSNIISYGLENSEADFTAKNIVFNNNGFPSFDLYKNNTFIDTIQLSVPGKHNVLNALACICVSDLYGISISAIKSALLKFTGAHRRFEYVGKIDDKATVFDDYAHHPTEIQATYNSLSNIKYNKSWVVFQPHTYSRMKTLLDDFAKVLLNFDNIIVLDIYAAREKNIYGISSEVLVDKLKALNKSVKYIPDFNECSDYIKRNVAKDDVVITLGAGTVTEISTMLID